MYFSPGTDLKRSTTSAAMDSSLDMRSSSGAGLRLFGRALNAILRSQSLSPQQSTLQNDASFKELHSERSTSRCQTASKKEYTDQSASVYHCSLSSSCLEQVTSASVPYHSRSTSHLQQIAITSSILRAKSAKPENTSTDVKESAHQTLNATVPSASYPVSSPSAFEYDILAKATKTSHHSHSTPCIEKVFTASISHHSRSTPCLKKIPRSSLLLSASETSEDEQPIKKTAESEIESPKDFTFPPDQYQNKELNHHLFPNKSVGTLDEKHLQLSGDDSYSLPIVPTRQPSSSFIYGNSASLNDSTDYSLPVMQAAQPIMSHMPRKEFSGLISSSNCYLPSLPIYQQTAAISTNKEVSLDSVDYSLPMTHSPPNISDSFLSDHTRSPSPSSGYPSSYDSDICVNSLADSYSETSSEESNVDHLDSSLSSSQQMDSPCSQELPPDDLVTPEAKTENFKSERSVTPSNESLCKNSQAPSSRKTCESCEADEIFYRREDRLRRQMHRKSILPKYDAISLLTFKSDYGFIDSHCHLDFLFQREKYEGTYTEYQRLHNDTFPDSYMGCVAVFCNPFYFIRRAKWGKILDENNVWAAFGCHPHYAEDYCKSHEIFLEFALEHSQVRALGEIGLDYSSRNNCSKEIQHFVFKRQLKIAVQKKLPVVIHCRDAHEDTMRILKKELSRNHKIHLHCFADEWKFAKEWLAAFPNLFIGITNVVTFHSAEDVHEVAKNIPLDRLLLETDAPYFVPRMLPRGTKWSHPGMAIHVAAQIAELRNLPMEEILHWTRKNTEEMYGI